MGLFVKKYLFSYAFIISVTLASFASNQSWAQTIEAIPKKSLREQLKEKIELSYYSSFSGTQLNGEWGKYVTRDNEDTQSNLYHSVRAGYRFSPTLSSGIVTRYSQDFTLRQDDKVTQDHLYELLNPRIYLRKKQVVDNAYFSLNLEGYFEIPTTEENRITNKMTTTLGFSQSFNIKQPIKKLSLSVSTVQQVRIYRVQKKLKKTVLALYPYVNYTFNDTWGMQFYMQITRTQRQEMPIHDSRAADDDYFRLGPTVNLADWIQLYVPIQLFLSNPTLNTATLGFEISAGL